MSLTFSSVPQYQCQYHMCESITETTERDNGTKTIFLYDTDF